MKKLKILGITTMFVLVLAIGTIAALAAFGVFETAPAEDEKTPDISIEKPEESSSELEWQTDRSAEGITAAIKTDLGDIVIKLGDCSAAEKFIELDNKGEFDSARFSTAAKDMFIQAFTLGENFTAEGTDYGCFCGAVGFVMDGDEATPNFFIITADKLSGASEAYLIGHNFDSERIALYKEHGGIPEYEGKVLIFAQVVSGMEVVKAIAEGENSGYTGGYSSENPVTINSIEISYPTE